MKIFILFILIIIHSICFSQKATFPVSSSVFEVSSVIPSDTNYHDLHFLDSLLVDNEVIFLGEKAHGEGTITLAKTRLIKYLTKELGYNTQVSHPENTSIST